METNFESMKVAKLKDLCRKIGVKGYSHMKKSELIDALKNNKEAKKVVLAEARDFAKNELGKDFGKAVSFWKQLNSLDYMSANDYSYMIDKWKILISLFNTIDEEGTENRALTDNLKDTAEALKDIFCPTADISGYSEDELKEFINSSIEEFSLSVFSRKLKKENTEIIKMSMDHIAFTEQGIAYFDSSKACKFTGTEVKIHKTDMRIVESSEDGISRMLMEKGLSNITVFMGKTAQGDDEMKLIEDAKDNIFRNGFFDIATRKHYMFAFQNPSSCRQANFMFVEAKDWNEVVALWLEITGLKDWEDFKRAFFDEEGKVVMAKLLARISTRGSNSFNLSKISPVWGEKIAQANIRYCEDPEWLIDRPFKTMKGPGCMELQKDIKRKTVPGDGQMIGSFEFHALMAVALRVISENEYNEFSTLWEKANKDIKNVKEGSRLYRLIKKIPGVFQLRHGEKKGICVRYNLEAIEELKEVNAIVPDSVRKFVAGEWYEFPLEICNYIKRKDEWVALNPQFIEALEFDNPNALIPIVDFWFDYMNASLKDIAKAQQFHGIIKSSDDEESRTVAGHLVSALRTSSDLIDDFQILNWREKQYDKFISDMKIGRILVPGMYTYMVCDPAFIINQVFDLDLPCLAEGEYYHNGKECQCGLFRSPLIHPFEAQKVKLYNNEAYWYMQDVIVFNGYDGAWDRMGGGDFDGDTCAVIPDDTEFGKIIVDGIRCLSFDIWEKAQNAVKKEFMLNNFIEHLVKSAKRDRTGVITNYASKALNISNHLKSAIFFAKELGCENITFLHPMAFGAKNEKYGEFGSKYEPQASMVNGVKSLCMKGFVEAKYNNKTKNVEFSSTGYVGTFSFEKVLEVANNYLNLVEILRILQGREIDGAKTGVYAEGVSGQDFIDAVKVKFTPHQMIVRQETLEREVAISAKNNKFWSLAPLARIHDYVCKKQEVIKDYFKNGSNKIFLLQSLLTKEEAQIMNEKKLVDIIALRKKEYNSKIFTIMDNSENNPKNKNKENILSAEETLEAVNNVKGAETEELYNLANTLNVSPELIAVANYLVTYNKNSKQSEGLTYGWLLFDELLSVFSRGNKKFELFRLPANVEKACIKDKVLYVNGNKHIEVNAEDCENVVIRVINGRPYANIHKIVNKVVIPEEKPFEYDNTVYYIGTSGFRYHITEEKFGKIDIHLTQAWKNFVAQNGYVFDIVMDETSRACIAINGKTISAVMADTNFKLNGTKVKLVNKQVINGALIGEIDDTHKEDDKKGRYKKGDLKDSIKNLAVQIIGKAD